jgi:exodeoxyribonuclease-5
MIPSQPDRSEQSLFKTDNSVLHDLVAFIKNGNKRNKVLFLGDRYQLAPISEEDSKALSSDFLEKTFQWQGKTSLLTEVKRQEDGSTIMKNAVCTRRAMEQGQTQATLDGKRMGNVWRAADDYVRGFKQQGPEHAICITASHGMNKMFNSAVRDKIFGQGAPMLEPGDLMMVTTNWRRNAHCLYNGDHVTVKEILYPQVEEVAGLHFVPVKIISKNLEGVQEEIEDYLLLESVHAPNGQLGFEAENRLRAERFAKNRTFSESGFPEHDRYVGALRLNYGYAITCHKAQGGEWDKVYINTFKIPDLRFQYTAVTRAKTDLLFY